MYFKYRWFKDKQTILEQRHLQSLLNTAWHLRNETFAQSHRMKSKEVEVKEVSQLGKILLPYKKNEKISFNFPFFADTMGRVTVQPQAIRTTEDGREINRFIEIKGYGSQGDLIMGRKHDDGDIMYGMFSKNARKEYRILNDALNAGIRVPIPVLWGKINREDWFNSAIGGYAYLINQDLVRKDITLEDLDLAERTIRELDVDERLCLIDELFGALKEPYNAAVLIRAPESPFRVGCPFDKHEESRQNILIAQHMGREFIKLLDLDYFHGCPGLGNWTTAGELTDMADCIDLRRDKNLYELIANREKTFEEEFWKNLIGPGHISNLHSYFIQGMFGEKLSLEEAAQELKQIVLTRYDDLQRKSARKPTKIID